MMAIGILWTDEILQIGFCRVDSRKKGRNENGIESITGLGGLVQDTMPSSTRIGNWHRNAIRVLASSDEKLLESCRDSDFHGDAWLNKTF